MMSGAQMLRAPGTSVAAQEGSIPGRSAKTGGRGSHCTRSRERRMEMPFPVEKT